MSRALFQSRFKTPLSVILEHSQEGLSSSSSSVQSPRKIISPAPTPAPLSPRDPAIRNMMKTLRPPRPSKVILLRTPAPKKFSWIGRMFRNNKPSPDGHHARLVGANTNGIPCPIRTAIQVVFGKGNRPRHAPIHANAIRFSRKELLCKPGVVGFEGARVVVAGQSPQQFELCEKFLLQGIDSGKGLFQFVDPATLHAPASSSERPIVAQLRDRMDSAAAAGGSLILGGRFKVVGLEAIADPSDAASDHSRFRLIVADVDKPSRTRTAILTQAGLKFDDNLLDVDEIERADRLATAHDRLNPRSNLAGQSGPMIVSHSGIGRNATLIAYREAVRLFRDVATSTDLDRLVDRIVAAGRRDRGPNFVHSEAQLQALKQAVQKAYARHQAQALPGRGVRFQLG